MVFFVSAYWHGYYFGFYAFFTGLFFSDLAWKTCSRTSLAKSVSSIIPTPIFMVLNTALSFTVVSYFGMAYTFYEVRYAFQMWDSFYYLGHIFCLVAVVLGLTLPKAKKE